MKTLLIILLLCSSAHADEWTRSDSLREATYLTFLAVDWAQTRSFLRDPQHHAEMNPLLGSHPEQSHLDAAVILTGLAHVYIASILPKEYRAPFQYVSIGIEGGAVYHNFSFGVKSNF